jgi:hypothetical protein
MAMFGDYDLHSKTKNFLWKTFKSEAEELGLNYTKFRTEVLDELMKRWEDAVESEQDEA